MSYLTGDTHRNFRCVAAFCDKVHSTVNDVLIILGDAGINYYGGESDRELKRLLAQLPITLFCIHGNHEQRPETLGYDEMQWNGGVVYVEAEFPNPLFAKDGEIYDFDGKKCIVIGGAYSVDKKIRLARNLGWWEDEQSSDEIKARVEEKLRANNTIDIVLSHTCPMEYIPREMFLEGIDNSKVDNSTELWLDEVEDKLHYTRWFSGHYHTDKTIDKLRFMFDDFLELR